MEFKKREFTLLDELKRDFKPGVKFIPKDWFNEPLVVSGEIVFNLNNASYYCNSGRLFNGMTGYKSVIVEESPKEEI